MKFESVSPWAVRSIKQRQLLNTWLRAYQDLCRSWMISRPLASTRRSRT